MKINVNYLKKLIAWLLPNTCVLCDHPSDRGQDLCGNCNGDLPWLRDACTRCAKPLLQNSQALVCDDCVKQSPPFTITHALFLYQAPITQLIMDLKFGHALVNARILGELLSEHIRDGWYRTKPLPEAIIPIPMHPNRIKERGFNQALEIARPISKALNIPLEYTKCHRIKHTAAQATLPARQRQQNVKSAFYAGNLDYRHVAVIDDVITTGCTVNEFCLALKCAGVEIIDIWCCARPIF